MSIDINNVSKSFMTKDKDFIAVKDINLHVDDGEFICLLGPSGCGKTTLLRMIGGLETPESGEIYADGNLVEGPSKDRGFIFQQYSLFPWLNVLDNVTFGLNNSPTQISYTFTATYEGIEKSITLTQNSALFELHASVVVPVPLHVGQDALVWLSVCSFLLQA